MTSHFFSFKNLAPNSKTRFLTGFLLVFIFQIWSTYKGIAKTNDSLEYLQTAQNLVLQYDFIQTNSQPYIAWALGFPFLLIIFKDSIFLNLLCILGIYAFYFDLIEKLFQKTITKWWLILAFVFATPLYLIHHFIWSEPPFLLFLMALIWAFYYAKETKKWFCFCLFGFLFTSMRNAGLYFVIGINSGIVIFYMLPSLFINEKKSFSYKIELIKLWKNPYLKLFIYFSFSSLLPIFLWWLHAKIKTEGNFDAIYNLALRTLSEEFFNYGDILSRWIFPPSIPLEIRVFLLLIFVISMSLVGTRATVEKILNRRSCPHEQPTKNTKFVLFIFWITSVYLIGMLLSRAGMKIDAERFLTIIYPFLCIWIGFVLDKMKVNQYVKYGIAFLWLIYPLLRTVKNIIFWN